MRKSFLVLALGLFLSTSVAHATDGDKTCKSCVKGKKAVAGKTAKCDMKSGTCNMKSGKCDMKDMKAMKDGGKCDMKAMAGGKKDCCKAKAEGATKS